MTKWKTAYSGNASVAFWKRVNSITNETQHRLAYNAGCVLQNTEELLLRMIMLAEKRGRKKRKPKT